MGINNKPLVCVQWNARGLVGSKLDEFRDYLSQSCPDVVYLSETHWNDRLTVKFRGYECIIRNRPDNTFGGVAILINKAIMSVRKQCPQMNTIEAVGATIFLEDGHPMDVLSIYVPRGQEVAEQEMTTLFNLATNRCIIAGDFNGHHPSWDQRGRTNRCGRLLEETINDTQNRGLALITPGGTTTRECPSTGAGSTIDLLFAHSSLATNATVECLPYMGSDHFPVVTTFGVKPARSAIRIRKWIFKDGDWKRWNEGIEAKLEAYQLNQLPPEMAYEKWHTAIMEVSHNTFRLTPATARNAKEPGKIWFNDVCRVAIREAKEARRMYQARRVCRGQWSRAEAVKKRTILRAKREAHAKFINSLNVNNSCTARWNYVKAMMGASSSSTGGVGTIVSNGGDPVTNLADKAELFADQFFPPSAALEDNPAFQQEIEEAIRDRSNNMDVPLTRMELRRALRKCGKGAMGADLVHNQMLANLSNRNTDHLQDLMNNCLAQGYVPQAWKNATVVPLLKPGKPEGDPGSYRPISLTSCVCKVMERVLNSRITWHLETRNLIPKHLAGFRPGKSTFDQISALEFAVRDGFSKNLVTVAAFLDIAKAYDATWIQGLILKCARKGIKGRMLGWIRAFLTNRTAVIRVGAALSKPRWILAGVPQGAVLSPTCFNIMMADFPLPSPETRVLIYADDVALYTSGKNPEEAERLLNPLLRKLEKWGDKWRLTFAPEKSAAVTFSRRKKVKGEAELFIKGHRIPTVSEFKFLGVWFDKKLQWKQHIERLVANGHKARNLFLILSNRKWGANVRTLTQIYKAIVRSRLDYGMGIIGGASKTWTTRIDRIQNTYMRIILGGMRNTRVAEMRMELGLETVKERHAWLGARYIIRVSHQPEHPNFDTITHLHNSSRHWPIRSTPALLHGAKKIREYGIRLPMFRNADHPELPPWSEQPIAVKWLPISKKEAVQNPTRATDLLTDFVDQLQPPYTLAYTDGSLTQNGRAAAAVHIPQWNFNWARTLTPGTGIYAAELLALRQAMEEMYNADESQYSPLLVICSDSNAAIRSLQNDGPTNHIVNRILNLALNLKNAGTRTIALWVPSHVGINGNEAADELAQAEARSGGSGNPISNRLLPTEITNNFKNKWVAERIAAN